MADLKDPIPSPSAIALIQSMARDGANTNAIRAALRREEGLWFGNAALIAAAAEIGLEIRPPVLMHEVRRSVVLFEVKPEVVGEKTVLVKPGTFPVRGFTMLRRK